MTQTHFKYQYRFDISEELLYKSYPQCLLAEDIPLFGPTLNAIIMSGKDWNIEQWRDVDRRRDFMILKELQ